MVGQAFELQAHAPQQLGTQRHADARQTLQHHAVGRAVAHAGVPGHAFHERGITQVGAAGQHLFHAAVLEAQADLQIEHVLAVALEAEVTGFDDARMHGAHGHFVDLAAFHAVVVALGRAGAFRARGGRGVAHGLEPGVALGHDAPGLADLTLEALELGAFLAHGRIAFQRQAAGGPQFLPLVMGP